MKAKKNNVALTRTSAFREDRKNYLTEDGYTYWRWDEDLKKEVPVHIGLPVQWSAMFPAEPGCFSKSC